MTKSQARARLKKLMEQLGDIRAELDDLKCEVEETSENIEPYEGSYDLTPEQEERQEWFEELGSTLSDLVDSIESAECELDEKIGG